MFARTAFDVSGAVEHCARCSVRWTVCWSALNIKPVCACAPILCVQIIENYLKPMRAHDWDRASLEMFRRSSFNGPNIDFAAIKAPVLIIEVRGTCMQAISKLVSITHVRACAQMAAHKRASINWVPQGRWEHASYSACSNSVCGSPHAGAGGPGHTPFHGASIGTEASRIRSAPWCVAGNTKYCE